MRTPLESQLIAGIQNIHGAVVAEIALLARARVDIGAKLAAEDQQLLHAIDGIGQNLAAAIAVNAEVLPGPEPAPSAEPAPLITEGPASPAKLTLAEMDHLRALREEQKPGSTTSPPSVPAQAHAAAQSQLPPMQQTPV